MKAESDSFWFPAIHGMMPEEFIIPFDCMKILMNNQNYLVWGIPRVVKSMIWEKKAIFWKTEFVTVNLENNDRKFLWMKTTTYPGHTNIEWYYDKEKFVNNLASYISLTEIESDFSELISTLKNIITSEKPDLIILNGTDRKRKGKYSECIWRVFFEGRLWFCFSIWAFERNCLEEILSICWIAPLQDYTKFCSAIFLWFPKTFYYG